MGYIIKGPADIYPAPDHSASSIVVMSERGRPYELGMVMPNGEDFCYADSVRDLICALIPGYEQTKEDNERAYLRIVFADMAAVMRQSEILAQLQGSEVTESEWATLVAPKTGPESVRAPWWRCEVPLLVVTTSYIPFTDRERPASVHDGVRGKNLWWIDPSDEETLITTLHEVGYVRVMSNLDFENVMLYEG
jgi:hypothetical protein